MEFNSAVINSEAECYAVYFMRRSTARFQSKKKTTLDIDIKTTNVKSKNQKEKRLPISFSLIHKPTANCDLASKQSL